jgi:hypothetical protein
MPRNIELTVAPPYVGDISCVRLDSTSMNILGVKEGEVVVITSVPRLGIPSGIRTSSTVAKAKVADEGKGLIRISPDLRDFSIGQKVIVMKSS